MRRFDDIDPMNIDPETNQPYSNYSSPSLDTSFHDDEMDVGNEEDGGWKVLGAVKVENDYEDRGCDSYTYFTTCTHPISACVTDVAKWVGEIFPPSCCHHEHDCCGNYYADFSTWSPTQFRDSEVCTILVRQTWSQNV